MRRTLWLAAVGGLLVLAGRAGAEKPDIVGLIGPATLGEVVNGSTHIAILQVEAVDQDKKVLRFRKTADLKGHDVRPDVEYSIDEVILRSDGRGLLDWARPGRLALCFVKDDWCWTCLGNCWYFSVADRAGRWDVRVLEEDWSVAYVGPVQQLCEHVRAILTGQEVIVTARTLEDSEPEALIPDCRSPLPRDWLHGRKGRVCRIRAGLRLVSPEEVAREGSDAFVGWGVGGPEVVPALTAALRDRDPLVRAEAAGDLEQLGPLARPALAGLRAALQDPDPYVRVYAAEAVARIDAGNTQALPVLTRALHDRDAPVRTAAAGTLALLGTPAVGTVAELRTVLSRDPEAEVRSAAAFALGEIVPEAHDRSEVEETVAILARALQQDADKDVSYWAARALVKFGPDVRKAVPLLLGALRDRGPRVAEVAADVLARLGPDVVPALGEALLDRKCRARRQVAEYLGDLGPAGRGAFPALVRALQDEDPWLRWQAASVLLRIDPDAGAAAAVPALAGIVESEKTGSLARGSLVALKEFGPRARAAAPALARALGSEDQLCRSLAADALGAIGPDAEVVAPALGASLRDEKLAVRVEAARALWRIRRDRAAVPALLGVCATNDISRWHAVNALGEIGPDAELAVPLLRRALRDANDPDRLQVAVTLWRLQRRVEVSGVVFDPRREALAVLVRLLQPGRPAERYDARYDALSAVEEIGTEAGEVLPALLALLRDEDFHVREQAAIALGAVGPDTAEAQAALTVLLRDENPRLRLAAARALARANHRPAALVPTVAEILERYPSLTKAAAQTLADLGPDARPAVPLLRRLLRHTDRSVYLAAARALRRIDPDSATRAGVP